MTNAGGFYTNEKNMNVIYLIPTDNPAKPDYEERMSDYLVYLQEWVRSEMVRNGFAEKTFGLPIDTVTNRVKIITITATEDKEYFSSLNRTVAYVADYRSQHPDEFEDTPHQFVLMPRRADEGTQPIVASGRNGFAADRGYTLQYCLDNVATSASVRSHFGGYLHEMLHGLNAGHDDTRITTQVGMASIMGNHVNFLSPNVDCILTEAQCALLNYSEVFQPVVTEIFYPSTHSTDLKIVSLNYNPSNDMLTLTGTYEGIKAEMAMVYFRNMTTGSREISWAGYLDQVAKTFSINCLRADLNGYQDADYEIRLMLLNTDGSMSRDVFRFEFENGLPVVDTKPVYVFKDCSTGSGRYPGLEYGSYTDSELIAWGVPDNSISAVDFNKFARGKSKLIAFDGGNFDGASQVFTSKQLCVFNDKTSSLMALPVHNGETEQASVYEHASYGGAAVDLNVGAYFEDDLIALGMNNAISSVKAVPGLRIVLFEDDNFRGNSVIIDDGTSWYLGSLNDKVSSILIYRY
jgi:hypothetical protein